MSTKQKKIRTVGIIWVLFWTKQVVLVWDILRRISLPRHPVGVTAKTIWGTFCFFGIDLRKGLGEEAVRDRGSGWKVRLTGQSPVLWHIYSSELSHVKLRSPGLCVSALLWHWVWAIAREARPWTNIVRWHVVKFTTLSGPSDAPLPVSTYVFIVFWVLVCWHGSPLCPDSACLSCLFKNLLFYSSPPSWSKRRCTAHIIP